jgi:hypothetical protein
MDHVSDGDRTSRQHTRHRFSACGETGVAEEAVRGVIRATWGIEVEAGVIDAASVTEGEDRRSDR